MPQSDLLTSLERLVNPSVSNMPSPVGTTFLRAAISKDPAARAIYNEILTPVTTKRAPSKMLLHSEKLPNYAKLSPLTKSSGKIVKSKKLTGNGFAPKLWR